MNYLERITFSPERCGGKPCVRGMRIRVKDVLDPLAAGVSGREILEDYPHLETDDLKLAFSTGPLKPTTPRFGWGDVHHGCAVAARVGPGLMGARVRSLRRTRPRAYGMPPTGNSGTTRSNPGRPSPPKVRTLPRVACTAKRSRRSFRLRVGNGSNPALPRPVTPLWPLIVQRIERGDRLVEVS
jgi:uncharacterized protein (DUF433 family)